MVVPKQIIAFRCDASPKIGSGHVMRCMTLARTLENKNFEIIFLTNQETIDTIDALSKSKFKIILNDTIDYTDWLVVDHYNLDHEYESQSRTWAKKIMVIDDLANRQHDCDVLVDQTYGRKEEDYKPLVPQDCHILTGSSYAMLRETFLDLRKTTHRDFSDPQNILISFGGVNPKKSTEIVLSYLKIYKEKPLKIDAITGSQALGINDIQTLVTEMNDDGFHQASLHLDTPDMAKFMAQADLCIGGGGTTSWERCCLKLPTLAIEVADNQRTVLKNLFDENAIFNLGRIEDITQETFLDHFHDYLSSPEKLEEMSKNASQICDGRGTQRLSCYLLKEKLDKSDKRVIIRMARANDCKQLFEWQQNPEIRQHSRTTEPPSWETHQTWFANILQNPDRELFIVESDNNPVGMVRLDKIPSAEHPEINLKTQYSHLYEVSILTAPEAQGQGIGKCALALLRSFKPNDALIAEVFPENKGSQVLFSHSGYSNLHSTWYISYPENE